MYDPKISLCSQSLFALPLEDAIDAAARAGYAAIELVCAAPHFDEVTARTRADTIALRIRDAGLIVSALSGFNRFTDNETVEDQLASAQEYIRLAPTFGTEIVKLTPGAPASKDATQAHWETLAQAVDRLIPVAESLGIRLAFETHMRQLTDTLEGARRLLSLTDAACVGLTVDFSNLVFAGEQLSDAIPTLGVRTFNTHVKNGTIRGDGAWSFLRLDEGWTDYADVFSALARIGYNGYLTVECLGDDARQRPIESAARDRRILERFLNKTETSP